MSAMVLSICTHDMAFSARAMFFTLKWLLLLDKRHATYVFNVYGCLRRVGRTKQVGRAKRVGRADWRVGHTDAL